MFSPTNQHTGYTPVTQISQGETASDDGKDEAAVPFLQRGAPKPTATDGAVAPRKLTPHGPAVPPDTKKFFRNFVMGLLVLALVQETAYFFYQAQNSGNGLEEMGAPKNVSPLMAWILAFGDFVANIAVTDPNDVDGVVFTTQAEAKNMWLIIPSVTMLSYASFLTGALASSIPVLKWMATKEGLSTRAKQALNPLAALLFGPSGMVYYQVFNVPLFNKTYAATSNYLKKPYGEVLRRMREQPSDILRYIEVYFFRTLAVTLLRATNFAFIPEDLLRPLLAPYGISTDSINMARNILAVITFGDTFIQVLFSRVIRSVEKLHSPLFEHVHDDEYAAALKDYKMTLATFLAHLASIISAMGYGLMAHSLMSKNEWEVRWDSILVATILSSAFFAKSFFVEHTADVYHAAIKNLNKLDKHTLLTRQNIDAETPTEMQARMHLADKHFNELADTFANSYRDAFFTGSNIVGRSARALAFYSFIEFFAGQLATVGVTLSSQQVYALCMILIPENFKNDYLAFGAGITQTVRSYLAKLAIETHIKKAPLSYVECITTHFKGIYSYNIEDIIAAKNKKLYGEGQDQRERLLSGDEMHSDGGDVENQKGKGYSHYAPPVVGQANAVSTTTSRSGSSDQLDDETIILLQQTGHVANNSV